MSAEAVVEYPENPTGRQVESLGGVGVAAAMATAEAATDNVVPLHRQSAEANQFGGLLTAHEQATMTPRQLELFEKFFPYVRMIARKIVHSRDGYELETAIGDGYIGLIRGIQNFDPSKVAEDSDGSSYIYGKIAGAIRLGMRSWFGYGEGGKVARTKLSVTAGTASSLDSPIPKLDYDDTEPLVEAVASPRSDDEELSYKLLKDAVFDEAREFDDREREVLFRRVFLGEIQSEIAAAMGTNQMNVSRSLKKMRRGLREKLWEQAGLDGPVEPDDITSSNRRSK